MILELKAQTINVKASAVFVFCCRLHVFGTCKGPYTVRIRRASDRVAVFVFVFD